MQTGPERAVIKAGVEDGGTHPLGGDAVAVRFRDALDEAVQAQASQVVGDLSRGELARLLAEQWSQMLADMTVSECALDENKQNWLGRPGSRFSRITSSKKMRPSPAGRAPG